MPKMRCTCDDAYAWDEAGYEAPVPVGALRLDGTPQRADDDEPPSMTKWQRDNEEDRERYD